METRQHTNLKFVLFQDLGNWSVRHLLGSDMGYSQKYSTVSIGDIIKKSQCTIEIKDDVQYKQITLKTNGGGAVLRGVKLGKDIGTKKQYVASSGQFIMSKIDARNGAFGLITEELDGAVVTADFPLFDVDNTRVLPEYLALVATTKKFAKFAQSCSRGTTNRQRIDINMFLSQHIPLPSLSEQDYIVKAYSDKNHKSVILEKEISDEELSIVSYLKTKLGIEEHYKKNSSERYIFFTSFKNLTRWSIDRVLNSFTTLYRSVFYPNIPIREVLLSITGGKTPPTSIKDYWAGDIFWVSAKDMKELFLDSISDTITTKAVKDCGLTLFPANTILCVFRSGILQHSFPICITNHPVTINQDLKAIIVDENRISKYFFVFYLSTLQEMVLYLSRKKGVTVESINMDDFLNIPIILPPKNVQNDIVDHIKTCKSHINSMRQKVESLRVEAINEFETVIFD